MSVRALIIACALAFVAGGTAHADKVSKKFGGQILTSDKRFPTQAKSQGAYISKLQKQKKTKFSEDKENKQWKIYFAAFFKKALGDPEYTIKFLDDHGTLLGTPFEQYTDSSGQTSVLSSIVLDRKTFGVNKRVTMIIESSGRTVARGKFQILGEAERYTGKVNFDEEEASGGNE